MRVVLASLLLGLGACAGSQRGGVLSDWMDEGNLQVHAISDEGQPLVGGGIVRRVGNGGSVGFRGLIPAWGTGSYTGEVFGRGYFTPEQPSSLFLEGDGSIHLVRGGTTWVPSVGLLFGVRVRVLDTLSVGGSFGPVLFPASAQPAVDFARLGPLGVAPRMLASVDFHL